MNSDKTTLSACESRSRNRRLGWLVVVSLLAQGGCGVDEPLRPRVPASESNALPGSEADGSPALHATARFDLSLKVVGRLQLGSPVTLEYRVRANLLTANAKVAVYSGDIEQAKASSWRARGRLTGTTRIASADEITTSLGANQTLTRSVSFLIPSAGYYRIAATVNAPDDPWIIRGVGFVQNFSLAEIGVWVDEQGGRVVPNDSVSLLPDSVRRVPGVRQFMSDEFRSPGRARLSTLRVTGSSANAQTAARSSSTNGGRIRYIHPDGQVNSSTPGLPYVVEVRDIQTNAIITAPSYTGGPDGEWWTVCPQSGTYIRVFFVYTGGGISVGILPNVEYVYYPAACGIDEGDRLVNADYPMAWGSLKQIAAISHSFFGETRGTVGVEFISSGGTRYDKKEVIEYWQPYDKILLRSNTNPSSLWGPYGWYAMAHEYGHAMHDDAFGGYPGNPGCPDPHYLDDVVSTTCAYVEGFGNFHAAATLGADLGQFHTETESNYYFGQAFPNGGNGRTNEMTVAAFLLDLVDPVGAGADAHDQVQYSGSYVGQIFETCNVRFNQHWFHGQDIAWNVFCFERLIDPFYSTTLGTAHQYQESASEPGSWDRQKIRKIWLKNLFNENYTPPGSPPPSLNVQIAGWFEVRPSYLCNWNAIVSGGTGTYSLQWSLNGVHIGSDSDWLQYANSGSSFTLSVIASDGTTSGLTEAAVTVSSGAGECPIF